MFQARRTDTNEIISADDLPLLPNVQEISFQCVDENCGIDLIPCSYGKSNKKRPFFKKHKGIEHNVSCTYGKFLKFLEIGKKRALTSEELEEMDYPSELVVLAKKPAETDSSTNQDSIPEESEVTRRKSTGEFAEVASTFKKVTAIDQIVDFYLECPNNRGVDLSLLGNTAPYKFQFRRILGKNKGDYIDGKIFYGKVFFGDQSVIERNGKTQFRLYECEDWVPVPRSLFNKKKQVNPYWVEVDNSVITKHKLSKIKRTRETVANESKNRFLNKKSKEGKEAFIFFLGTAPQDANDYTFKAVNGFVTFRFTKILKEKVKPAL